MRLLPLLAISFCFSVSALAQSDVCTPLNTALTGAGSNFDNYTNYQFLTRGGQSAYLADFSFVAGATGYIYKDNGKNENYSFQKLTDDNSTFDSWYRSFEQCLLKQRNKWTKLDGQDGKSVIFSSAATGVEVILISGSAGITIKIARDKKKSIPVLAANFCQQLEKLAEACAHGFTDVTGAYKDSGVLGRMYQSTVQLNQRGPAPTIYVGKDIFNQNKPKYSMTEMISSYEVPYGDLLSKIGQCLTESSGWKKEKLSYGEGVQFTKGEVSVSIRSETSADAASFIEIGTYTKF